MQFPRRLRNQLLFIFFIFFNVYLILRQRETEHEWERVRERGRHRIWNRLQVLSCQHRARHGAPTHKPWDRDLTWSWMLNQLSHPGTPREWESFFFSTFIYLWDRERQSMNGRGAEREGDTESEACSRLWAVSIEPDVDSNPRTLRLLPALKFSA